jgi:hypothetical protein
MSPGSAMSCSRADEVPPAGWPPSPFGSVETVRRRIFAFLVLAAFGFATAAPAQTVGEIADAVERRGYYAEPEVVSINAMEELAQEAPGLGFVALANDVDDADFVAEDVVSRITSRSTVIVLTPSQVGVASVILTDQTIDAALDVAFATTGDSYETDFRQFIDALPQGRGEPVDQSRGGGFSFGWVVLIGVAVVGVIVWRGSRRDSESVGRRVEAAKREIGDQMSVIANQILELSDRIGLSENDEAEAHFRRGSEIFGAAEGRLEKAEREQDLADLSDDLDDARWELAAAEALLTGADVPPRPEDERKPEPCFFDPTHGAGIEEATLETPAGKRTVMVCRPDADRLRRGERPDPRVIEVGGRQYPAAQAPRSHGGGGLDWLDVFSVVVGGMGDAARYRWSPRGRRSGGFGGLGTGLPIPGRRSSTGGGSRSSSSAGSAARPSRTVSGRGRRSR